MNDDETSAGAASVEGILGVFALAAIIGSSGTEYVSDLAASVRRLFGGDGLEAALREERARNKATVLALAVIADGAVTDAERPALEAFAKGHGVDADEILAGVTKLAEQLRDPRALRERIARSAAQMDADERLDVYVAVKNLAHRGSAAWPEEAGYRGAARPTPEALISAFREALGITFERT